MNKQSRLTAEDDGVMRKETIIYFETLGFGWVFDHTKLAEMNLSHFGNEILINNSLIRIIENILSDNSRF